MVQGTPLRPSLEMAGGPDLVMLFLRPVILGSQPQGMLVLHFSPAPRSMVSFLNTADS